MTRKISGVLAATFVALAAYACGAALEAPIPPQEEVPLGPYDEQTLVDSIVAADSATADTSLVAAADTVFVLKRLAPLALDISASAEIGPDGGTLRIADAGVVVDFPAGAVATPTTVTMTAKSGWDVAYEFEPHGITFAVPVVVTQQINGTLAQKHPKLVPTLQGTYFGTSLDSSFVDPYKLFARAVESRHATYDASTRALRFTVEHFSGYLVSSGRQQPASGR